MTPTADPPNRLLVLMAVACGLCAGSNYINQPLLHSIAHGLQVSEAQAAYSVTISQLSYACGLLLLVPLGDLLDRRRLIVVLMSLAALGLLLCGLTGSIAVFWLGSALAGVFSVGAQVLVPFVTLLVAPQHAGRAVGVLMTGLLVGIQAARSVSGMLSESFGWQFVYLVLAAALLLVALALSHMLPRRVDSAEQSADDMAGGGYPGIMRSLGRLFLAYPRLRSRALIGALSFGSFSVLFSTMALLLGGQTHGLSDMQIGLISSVGVVSALAARPVGRRADQGRQGQTSMVCSIVLLACWPVMWLAPFSISAFVIAFLLLALCIAALHISNQSVVFTLTQTARSRTNALYMTSYFLGAAAGSSLGVLAWYLAGWAGVCILGLALSVATLMATLSDRRLEKNQTGPALHSG